MANAGTTAAVTGGTIRKGSYVITPRGLGYVTSIMYTDPQGRPHSRPIGAAIDGQVLYFKLTEVRKATFREFAINKNGFGRTSWPQFAFLQTMCLGLLATGFLTWSDGGWVAHAFFLAVEGVLLYGTWGNFTGRIR